MQIDLYWNDKQNVTTKIKEHRCWLLQPEKLVMAQYILANTGHDMLYKEINILSSSLHFITQLHWEAIEIFMYGFNINQKEKTLRFGTQYFKNFRLQLKKTADLCWNKWCRIKFWKWNFNNNVTTLAIKSHKPCV